MYCEFFGFRESPFSITPNPRFLFISEQHRDAYAHLVYGVESRAGFIELTGEVGTGKTTLLRTFLNRLDAEGHRTAYIFNPCLSSLELLQSLNREFGLPWERESRTALLEILNAFLLEQKQLGHCVVLVLDEAQNLSAEVLEQIRLISNLETETDKLIQIVLAGQPELLALLAREDLRQLNQRITVRYHLRPMGIDCMRRYIEHRIELAGKFRAAEFTPAAQKLLYRYSGGVPRLVNIACDRALLVAYTEDTRVVSGKIAGQAIRELVEEASFGKGARLMAQLARFIPALKR
ncbi:ExeA family protein [Geomesophilobacter sediminis]|uniref:AAA family ATPase n=1 Tax=Geomesophilobacter sediminis TaxID=2798584 RepID=A0A8J7LXJ1_9BACT|nr:AAA family ATPase [Geomesophilobacter sediminis]MBJ6723181.1 AAA family ATPase [Geomesophilobacter sediminis]